MVGLTLRQRSPDQGKSFYGCISVPVQLNGYSLYALSYEPVAVLWLACGGGCCSAKALEAEGLIPVLPLLLQSLHAPKP